MTRDNEPAIEVEVLEIDGAAPPPSRGPTGAVNGVDPDEDFPSGHTWTNWQRWPGQVRTLHPFWWPLLIVGGGMLLAVVLTFGVIAVVLLIIYRIIRGLLRALFE